MRSLVLILITVSLLGCQQKEKSMKNYVIEVTTFKYKQNVNAEEFWKEDAKIQDIYTSKQPGYISRESGYADNGEILVLVKWESNADADASMKKFMEDQSVMTYANMIDGLTMKMNRYLVE